MSEGEGGTSDVEGEDFVLIAGLLSVFGLYLRTHYAKEPCHTSVLTGSMYYHELTQSQSPVRFYRVARMSLRTFKLLLSDLESTNKLPSNERVCSGERLLILLYIISGNSSRAAQERWQHGPGTISRIVRQCVAAIGARWSAMVSLPSPDTPAQIRDSAKYYPYFKDCIGAFDGTHIPVVPPSAIAPRFRNRKGFCSSDMLAACNFAMEFVYVLSGWEGSAHDGRVLMDAVGHDFRIPRGPYGCLFIFEFYYLSLTMSFARRKILPGRCWVRVEQLHTDTLSRRTIPPKRVRGRAAKATEHARALQPSALITSKCHRTHLRSSEEQVPILRRMTSYSIDDQVDIIRAVFAIHNFIRVNHDEFAECDTSANATDTEEADEVDEQLQQNDDTTMKELRDEIASSMWRDYLVLLAGRYGEVVV
jgi:hypothetical protein